jgi:hypothetical protein
MRLGPATPAALLVDFLSCHCRRRSGGATLVARQRSQGVPHLPKPTQIRDPKIAKPQSRGGQRPIPLTERDGGGGRNARATSTRSRAFQNVPRQFTLENHRLPLALPQYHPASTGKLTFAMNPLWDSLSRAATGNTHRLVQKLWTTILPCGKARKTKNKSSGAKRHPRDSIT